MPTLHLEPVLHRLRMAALEGTDADLVARFVAHRDEAAFAALVRRHGPLVRGVCRRVLGDDHAADDAFQATFFLLARKAAALAAPERLAGWLHGVACRIAARARVEAARRRACERRATPSGQVFPDDGVVWREVRGVLDDEVNRLPDRYRTPIVLCYLEGRTNAEAAVRLGCSRGTVATLLARGRERLRRRLAARGLALPALVVAVSVPAALQADTVRTALLFAAGPVAGRAATLAKGVASAMLIEKLKLSACVLTAALALTWAGTGWLSRGVAAEESRPPEVAAAKESNLSANFEVIAPTPELAKQIGRAAEEHRKELALLWLGKELPTWRTRCPIRVKLTEQGQGSATTFAFQDGKVLSQEMLVEGKLEGILTDLLPHEITHAILAHHLGRPVPRWADEGAAVLSESAAAGSQHARALQALADEGRLIPLRTLLPMREYPKDVMALYTQGCSLTTFLVKAGGRGKFLRFLARADGDGWDEAVKALYGYASVDDLEKAWRDSLGKGEAKRAVGKTGWSLPRADTKSELPTSPAPEQAFASMNEDGKLVVRRSGPTYRPTTAGESKVLQPVRVQFAGTAPLEDVKVTDTSGRVIERAELVKRLAKETLVLLSVDGEPVDPLHLRLVKDGTLVLVWADKGPPPVPPLAAPAVERKGERK